MKNIFQIKIKEGHTFEEYVGAWKAGSELIQKQPGAKGTKLFRKVGEPDMLLAIADWESKEARDQAMENLRNADPETQKVWQAHSELGIIVKIGEFEETEWEVLPK